MKIRIISPLLVALVAGFLGYKESGQLVVGLGVFVGAGIWLFFVLNLRFEDD